ncbi:hypothetical protein Csa_003131 [Cucumis sativus]|nr:hypothetical protein Csa_003131 [Cucumis sativus]
MHRRILGILPFNIWLSLRIARAVQNQNHQSGETQFSRGKWIFFVEDMNKDVKAFLSPAMIGWFVAEMDRVTKPFFVGSEHSTLGIEPDGDQEPEHPTVDGKASSILSSIFQLALKSCGTTLEE